MIVRTLLLCLLAAAGAAADGDPEVYRRIGMHVDDEAHLRRIWSAGIDFEGSTGKPGGRMEFVAAGAELRELDRMGIAYEVTEPDLARAALRGLSQSPMDALGFGVGTMGGYYTFAEVEQQLDSMRLLHPGIASAKQLIGASVDGRPIWAVRISDNPDIDEADEPEVLYTSLTHAREPAGMMTVLYYMWWLLEQYGADPRATYLVNNRQIWFIPVVNPDGYVHNQTTNPAGGGLWRKNRRNNGNGTTGVDLNRNYGPEHMWNAPNGGSSTNPASDTYRGTTPFSEPETQSIDTFLRLRSIRACLNYHTHGRLLIYPYGYLSAESPDSSRYRELAFDMARVNRYSTGTDQQTVNYSTRGNSDDYMYGDTTKFRTYAMTPEVGTSFWPPSSQILPMASENLAANIHYSTVAGMMPALDGWELSPSTLASGFRAGQPFSVEIVVRNRGLADAAALTVRLESDSGELHPDAPSTAVASLPAGADTSIVVSGTVDAAAAPGSTFLMLVTVEGPGGYVRTDTVPLATGAPVPLFFDDAESGTGAWITEGSWGLSSSAHDGAYSLHDSPAGVSASWSSAGIRTASPIQLSGYTAATLSFWTTWAIEPTFDVGVVKVSTDGGSSWTVLTMPLSNTPSGRGAQAPGLPGYDAYTPGLRWVRQEADLTAFAGGPIDLRFELLTDGADGRDGWFLDDIAVTGYRGPVAGSGLTVSTPFSEQTSLFFGEVPGAGDGLDTMLGETELGPAPPPGTFDARWEIQGTNGSLTDIRPPLAAVSDTNRFTLRMDIPDGEYPVAVRWDRTALPPGSWRISDAAGAVLADLWTADELLVPAGPLEALVVTHTSEAVASIPVSDRWNLVSLPVVPADSAVAAVFPSADGRAWAFDGAYAEVDRMTRAAGYWIRSSGADTAEVRGVPADRAEASVTGPGWVIVGSAWCATAVADLCTGCPQPPVLYGYEGGYYLADTLKPGVGYWYRGPGALLLDCRNAGSSGAPATRRTAPRPARSLTVFDGGGGSTVLRFDDTRPAGEPPGRYALPPVPPGDGFDARFRIGTSAAYFDEDAPDGRLAISVRGSGGPAFFVYDGPGGDDGRYELEVSAPNRSPMRLPLRAGATVAAPDGAAIALVRGPAAAPAASFRLHGTYPNPFNPVATIVVDLPAPSRVSLRVRDAAGREVPSVSADLDAPAGRNGLTVDGRGLASGVYFFSITAVGADPRLSGRLTGKLILLR